MIISVLDLELPKGKVIPKNKVQYYVMAGEECVDSLILGNSNAQTQLH